MGEEKGAWLRDGVLLSREGGKYVFIGDRVCVCACMCESKREIVVRKDPVGEGTRTH